LFLIRLSSLCLCRFSAEFFLAAIYNPRLFKIRWTPLGTFTFFAFGYIFNLSVLEKGLHPDFPPAGTTEKFLGRAGSARVFTGLGHSSLLLSAVVRTIIVKAEPGSASLPVLPE
jgi:hypothetical protein